jgi:hypothetical protein
MVNTLFLYGLQEHSNFKIDILTPFEVLKKCRLGISLFRETHTSEHILVVIIQEHHLPKLAFGATLE